MIVAPYFKLSFKTNDKVLSESLYDSSEGAVVAAEKTEGRLLLWDEKMRATGESGRSYAVERIENTASPALPKTVNEIINGREDIELSEDVYAVLIRTLCAASGLSRQAAAVALRAQGIHLKGLAPKL